MALRVTGRGIDLGEALTARIEARVAAALTKYFDGDHSGHVRLARDGTAYRADCVLHLATGTTLEASGSAHDPSASFDQAAERIEKRLRRYNRRLKAHPASGAGGAGLPAAYAVLEAPAGWDDEDEDDRDWDDAPAADGHPPVIAESTRTLRRHAVSEAVAELDLTGAPVVVFVHAASGRVNVVYRRSDGAIGWVDPQEPAPARPRT